MKRLNGEGTLRRRKDGTWEARYYDTNGNRHSVYGKTQHEVRAKLKKSRETKQPLPATEKLTTSKWLKTWLSDYTNNLKLSTKTQYETIIQKHIIPAFGSVELSHLTTQIIQRKFINKLSTTHSAKSVRNMHGVLHTALHRAVKLDLIDKNPADACVLPPVLKPDIPAMDIPDFKRLMNTLLEDPDGIMFLVDMLTGLRAGELIGLTWDCIDFERGVIRVTKQIASPRKPGQKYRWAPTKSSNNRSITPAPLVMELLRKQQVKQKMEKDALGDAWNSGDFKNLVFTMKDGRHYTQSWIYKMFQDFLKKAGIETHYRVHDLRHTYVVNAIRAGDDVKTVQTNAGHYSAAFTLDRYAHVTDSMKKESAARMQAFINSI